MKKDCSELQQKALRKLVRCQKPTLPVMSVPVARKSTLPAPVGRRTTRSEAAKIRAEKETNTTNIKDDSNSKHSDESSESTDSQLKTNDSHSDTNALEEKSKKPRKKRISRALFRHDTIDFIKPKKQELLQKTFSFKFKKLVDKSKEIYTKNGELINDYDSDDNNKEMAEFEEHDRLHEHEVKSSCVGDKPAHNKRSILDMPSLDSPNSELKKKTQKIDPNKNKTHIESRDKVQEVRTQSNDMLSRNVGQIQTNSTQNLAYPFYGIIPNRQPVVNDSIEDQIPKYKITIVPDANNRVPPQNNYAVPQIKTTHQFKIKTQKYPEKQPFPYPYLPPNNQYGYPYHLYPYLPPIHTRNNFIPDKQIWRPAHQTNQQNVNNFNMNTKDALKFKIQYGQRNLTPEEAKKLNCTVVKDYNHNLERSKHNQNLEGSNHTLERSKHNIERSNNNFERPNQHLERSNHNIGIERSKHNFLRLNQNLELSNHNLLTNNHFERPNHKLEQPNKNLECSIHDLRSNNNFEHPNLNLERSNQTLQRLNNNLEGSNSNNNLRQNQTLERSNLNLRPNNNLERSNHTLQRSNDDLEGSNHNLERLNHNLRPNNNKLERINHTIHRSNSNLEGSNHNFEALNSLERSSNNLECPNQNLERSKYNLRPNHNLEHSNHTLQRSNNDIQDSNHNFEASNNSVRSSSNVEHPNQNLEHLDHNLSPNNNLERSNHTLQRSNNNLESSNHNLESSNNLERSSKNFERPNQNLERSNHNLSSNNFERPNINLDSSNHTLQSSNNNFEGSNNLERSSNNLKLSSSNLKCSSNNLERSSNNLEHLSNNLERPSQNLEPTQNSDSKRLISCLKPSTQAAVSKIPQLQNVSPGYQKITEQTTQKRTLEEIKTTTKRVRFETDSPPIILPKNTTSQQNGSVIVSPSNKQQENEQRVIVENETNNQNFTKTSVIKKVCTHKNQHTIENILASKSTTQAEVNNNNLVEKEASKEETENTTAQNPAQEHVQTGNTSVQEPAQTGNISVQEPVQTGNISAQEPAQTGNTPAQVPAQKSVIMNAQNIAHIDLTSEPDDVSLNNDTQERPMPKLIKISEQLLSKVEEKQQPLNLSLKAQMRQSIIVKNTKIHEPLDISALTLVKSEDEYIGYLKLLQEKNATGPYLFYKFVSDVRKRNNQPIFDLVTFFSLLKQGKLLEYKNMYNQCNKC